MKMVSNPYWATVHSPLDGYVDGFRDELLRLGYTPLTAAAHVRLMAHLSRWLAREALSASALTSSTVDGYFAERRAAGYYNERTPRALRPLVSYLRRLGVVPAEPSRTPTGPLEVLLSTAPCTGMPTTRKRYLSTTPVQMTTRAPQTERVHDRLKSIMDGKARGYNLDVQVGPATRPRCGRC